MKKILIYSTVTFLIIFVLAFISWETVLRIKYKNFQSIDEFEKSLGVYVPLKKIIPSCDWDDTLYPHPYLGVIHGGNQECKLPNVNSIGTVGPEFPSQKNDKYFDILLTGGSVAYNMYIKEADRVGYLKPYLEKNFIDKDGRRIRVFNGAVGSWKQPQQFIFHALHGENFDAIISIEGANEFSNDLKYKIAMPFTVVFKYLKLPDVKIMTAKVITGFFDTFKKIMPFSYLARMISIRVNEVCNRIQYIKLEDSFLFKSFLKKENRNIEDKVKEYIKFLEKFNVQTQLLNQKFEVFLQPVLANFKIKHANEENINIENMMVTKSYAQAIYSINQASLNYVTDLTKIFSNNSDDIYFDYVHFKYLDRPFSKGHKILSEQIGTVLMNKWKLQKVQSF